MVKHTQTNRRLLPTNCLSVFDHFVGFPRKLLKFTIKALTQHDFMTNACKGTNLSVSLLFVYLLIITFLWFLFFVSSIFCLTCFIGISLKGFWQIVVLEKFDKFPWENPWCNHWFSKVTDSIQQIYWKGPVF